MPRFDGTGPTGNGPGTGRAMGNCGAGIGSGLGMSFGMGAGMGLGCWCGCRRFYSSENQLEVLEQDAAMLERELKAVKAEIQALNT